MVALDVDVTVILVAVVALVAMEGGRGWWPWSRPDHLNSHVRQVHSTERPFKCETCDAAFATKDRLRAHAVRHEEKVPCHVCGKMLSAAYITDHMKVHGQGPNHVCELCNKGSGEPCPMATPAPPGGAVAVLPMEGGVGQPW
ncbi:myc-associated zinc finger protein [Grus japonensis]|uniref:Myc-associated zinc finger protein n=1 Tax=Grus japonensis TaxID=30415 RepID=A0ABC9XYL7_GRUJA